MELHQNKKLLCNKRNNQHSEKTTHTTEEHTCKLLVLKGIYFQIHNKVKLNSNKIKNPIKSGPIGNVS
jgi:aromatic ring-opening dioxygenase catalytic subunit (LigB family)